MERTLYDLLETLIQAKYTRNRKSLLDDANLKLEILRFQVRLANDLQCLRANGYAFAARQIDEIGKLVGGWLTSPGYSRRLKMVIRLLRTNCCRSCTRNSASWPP